MLRKIKKFIFSIIAIGSLFVLPLAQASKTIMHTNALQNDQEYPPLDPVLWIKKVAFRGINQPIAGETAPTIATVAMDAKYDAKITWSPSIEDDGIFKYDTAYTAIVTLEITENFKNQGYYFNDDVMLTSIAGTGWELNDESTIHKLVYEKTFEKTSSVKEIDSIIVDENNHLIITFIDNTTADAGYVTSANLPVSFEVTEEDHLIVHYVDNTEIDLGFISNNNLPTSFEINEENHLIVHFANNNSVDLGYVGNDNKLPTTIAYIALGLSILSIVGITALIVLTIKKLKKINQ